MSITFEDIEAFVAPIKIDWSNDGKYILGNEMYLGGGVANLKRRNLIDALSLVMHEVSHFIEIDDVRALHPSGWGLNYGTYVQTSSYGGYHDYKSDAHLQRELRVYAIQSRLFEYFGMSFDIESAVLILQEIVSGFYNLPGESDEEKTTLAITKVNELRQQPEYSLVRILAEFERKKELFRAYAQDSYEVVA